MQYNPEAIADRPQVVYQDQQATVTRQPLMGGAGGVYTGTKNEEKDAEAQMFPGETVATTTTRQTVRPSPTHNAVPSKTTTGTTTQQRSGGGFLGNFATRTKGRFFFPLHAAIVFFSFLVLVSAALIEDNTPAGTIGNQRFVQYALVVSQVSFAVSLGACVMERLGLLENTHIRVALSAFQVFVWAPALVLLTFFGAFVSPLESANGFFGAWGALAASAVIFSHETDRSQRDPRQSGAPRTSLFLLTLFSLMIMGTGIRLYYNRSASEDGFSDTNQAPWTYTVFSIAFGAITAFLSIMFLLFLDMSRPAVMLSYGTFLWFWVAAGILVLTFGDPFEQALGNGYYSCLFALLSSFGLLVSLRRRDGNKRNAANANTTTTTTTQQQQNRYDDDYDSTFFLFVRGGTFASLVVLISAAMTCRETGGCQNNLYRFQIAAGAVSLGLGLIVVLLEAFGLYRIQSWIKIGFSLFWLVWWIACFIILTFFGSFRSPTVTLSFFANGFFFTWVALIFSALAFAEALKDRARVSDPPSPLTAKTGFLLVIILGSLIELGAGIRWYYNTNNSPLSRYAMSLGAVSVGLVIILFFVLLCTRSNFEAHDSLYNAGLYLLTIWWAVGTLILTFNGFWNSAVDNGYFSIYFTLGACLLALSGMWRTAEEDDLVEPVGTATRAYH